MDFPKPDGSFARKTGEELWNDAMALSARLQHTASANSTGFASDAASMRMSSERDIFDKNFAADSRQIAAEIIDRKGLGEVPDGPADANGDPTVGMHIVQGHLVGYHPLLSVGLFLEYLARRIIS